MPMFAALPPVRQLTARLLAASLVPAAALAAAAPHPPEAAMPPGELAACERLVERVRAERVLTFVREGRAYGAGTAAAFLKRKLDAAKDRVGSCAFFVEHVGSKSITTGRPYLMRAPDGTERPVRDWLLRELSALRPAAR